VLTSELDDVYASQLQQAQHCCSSVLIITHRISLIRTADSFTSFRSQLKTYTFTRHLKPVHCPRLWYRYQVFRAL